MSTFTLSNVGIHKSIRIDITPGLTLLTGPNGCGKTTAINAIVRATDASSKTPVAARNEGYTPDGDTIAPTIGRVEGPGIMLRVGEKVTKTGAPTVQIVNTTTLHRIVTGDDLEAPAARDRIRLTAIMEALPIPATADNLAEIQGGLSILKQEQTNELIRSGQSILTAAKLVKDTANAKANELKTAAVRASAIADQSAATLASTVIPEVPTELVPYVGSDLDAIAASGHALGTVAATTRERANRRAELEVIRDSMGARPDVSEIFVVSTTTVLADLADQVAAAQAELDRLIGLHRAAQSDHKVASAALQAARLAAQEYDTRLSQLTAIDSLPTMDDADKTDADLAAARESYRLAREAKAAHESMVRAMAERNTLDATATAKRAEAEEAAAASKAIAAYVKTIPSLLGSILAARGLPGITVDADGRIYAIEGETRTLFDERSTGQRISTMLDIAMAANPSGIFPIDPGFLAQLQPSKRKALAETASARGLCVVSEWPTDDDSIGIRHLTGSEDSELWSAPDASDPLPPAPVAAPAESAKTSKPTPKLSDIFKI